MPLNTADIQGALRELYTDVTTPNPIVTPDLNTSGWRIETSPYVQSGTAYYVPALEFGAAGTILTYPGFWHLQYYEYSSITMGSEGQYLPIRFDEEYI
jgi:hypothetical protein